MYLEALSMACQALQDWGARVGGVTGGEILQAQALPQQLVWQSACMAVCLVSNCCAIPDLNSSLACGPVTYLVPWWRSRLIACIILQVKATSISQSSIDLQQAGIQGSDMVWHDPIVIPCATGPSL